MHQDGTTKNDTKLYPLVRTSWEELACWNYSPCIYAYKATDSDRVFVHSSSTSYAASASLLKM